MPIINSGSSIHINTPLTNLSIAYLQDPSQFIADKVFPVVPVTKQSDTYYVFDRDMFLKTMAARRAPGTKAVEKLMKVSTDSYNALVFALETVVPDEIRINADAAVDIDEMATQIVTDDMRLSREKQFIAKYFTTGIWGTDYTPADLWSDGASSNPIYDIDVARNKIWRETGRKPNKLIVGPEVDSVLKQHPIIVERFKYTTPTLPATLLASLFEVDEYLVAGAIQSDTAEGATSISNSFVAGKNALLLHAARTPSLLTPSAGYIFAWRGLFNTDSPLGIAIDERREDSIVSDVIRGHFAYDMKVTGASLGYFFSGVVE
jgi:hypothetical protein